MRHLFPFLALLVVFATAPAAGPRPSVVKWTTETEHDFGTLRAGNTATFTFTFQNVLTEPIVLETVRTTCGCTAADWTEAPVEAGQSGQVLIEYSADRRGDFKKKITVFFDKQRKAETLWITGVVE
ncbi:MAG: DUF1573 domain-containing protein [Saprospiraceae bacterium]